MRAPGCLKPVLLALLVPCLAFADRGETYVLVAVEPGLASFADATSGVSSDSAFSWGGSLGAYYGLTNAVHLGAVLHLANSKNLAPTGVVVTLADGSSPKGTLFENTLTYGAGLLGVYRLDTGYDVAPILSAEVGMHRVSYSGLLHIPEGASIGIELDSKAEWVPAFRGGLAVEYRFTDSLVTSLGLGFRRFTRGSARWQLELPISIGFVW